MKTALACLAAASALALMPATAAPKPKWEIGVGAFGTYGPAYWGSSESDFGGFPVLYVTYRGDGFSILSEGLFDVNADDTDRFSFGLSLDGNGGVDSEDRLFLGDIDPVIEAGPKLTFALFANGQSRLEVSVAARIAYEFGEDFQGYVIEPSVAYLTTLSPTTRLGFSVTPKFGFDDYNDLYYSTPGFDAESGYIGTALALNLVNDISDRFRISAEAKVILLGGAENEDSPLVQEDTNYSFRLGFTYSIWQSDTMTGG
jgi:outer membrane scaffolding protein for murein synthesis (MipA/OmpV family)